MNPRFAHCLLCLLVLAPALCHADTLGEELQGSFIWLESAPEGQQTYAVFRKTFDAGDKPGDASLAIFADSRYLLWLNGRYIERGPCRFDPQAPEYDLLDVAPHVKPGENILAVLVHHYHDGQEKSYPKEFNGRTMRHAPGFTLKLDVKHAGEAVAQVKTDNSWRVSTKTRFQPSPNSWTSIPDNIDARLDDGDWTQLAYEDAGWQHAVAIDGNLWGPLGPRAIPLQRETRLTPARLMRLTDVAMPEPQPMDAVLPVTLQAGQELVFDAGKAVLAYKEMTFDAEEGTELELLHGSGYRDGNLDEVYLPDRYVAKAGPQTYMSTDVRGFRYGLIRVKAGSLKLERIDLVERMYPFDVAGAFACNDAFLNELWKRSVRTLQLCSEDGYVDCSGRERAEWMGDAAICEYPVTRIAFSGPGPDGAPCYADPRLARNILWHVALSQQPDGRVKAHHPSDRWDIHGYIEDYACLWIQTLRTYYEATGDAAFVRRIWPYVKRQLAWFLEHRSERGLVCAREFVFTDNPLSYKVCEGATLNAYVVGALRNAAMLGRVVSDEAAADQYAQEAERLAALVNEYLWDEAAQTYCGGIMNGEKTEPTAHAALLALYYNVTGESRRASALKWLVDHHGQVGSPYSHHFLFEVFYNADQPELDALALDIMRSRWASTLARTDLDTVFEGFGGGSLCHNIGALPAYFLSTRVLGVRMAGPAAEGRILVEPRPGGLEHVEGKVVTELGLVPVSWKQSEGRFTLALTVPEKAVAEVRLPAGGWSEVRVNGLQAKDVPGVSPLADGRPNRYTVKPGTYTFEAAR